MSTPIKLHGYKKTFLSKAAAIRFLLTEDKLTKTQIAYRLNCTTQQIHIEAKKLGLSKNGKIKN